MAKVKTITVAVTTNFRETMARELREAAEALEPAPPSPTAEDLRGAQAEIERLRAIIRGDTPDAERDCMVEKVSRVINTGMMMRGGSGEIARAVLAALAGDQ